MDRCRRSYMLLVRKFRTSEMLDKWRPTSKLPDIKLFHYPDYRYIVFTCTRTRLSAIRFKPIFWHLQIFSLVYYDWILSIAFAEFLQRFCGLVFFLTLLEFSLTEFPRGFYPMYFLLGLRKKDTGKRARKKMFLQTQSKISVDNSFRKIKLLALPHIFGRFFLGCFAWDAILRIWSLTFFYDDIFFWNFQ